MRALTENSASAEGLPRKGTLGKNVRWAFSKARWALIAVAVVIHFPFFGLAVLVGSPSDAPLFTMLAILAWLGLGYLGMRERPHPEERWLPGFLLADVVLLTALLSLSGGALNPFSMLYFVPIALSTLLPERATWTVAMSGVFGFCGLLTQTALIHLQHGHFFQHVVGMAIALAISGALVTYFVHLVAGQLAVQEAQVARLEQEQEQNRVATSLGALAAGAAHELGTPLGTVQLLVSELLYLPASEQAAAQEIVVGELGRIKRILHAMSSSELSAAQVLGGEPFGGRELEAFLRDEFSDRVRFTEIAPALSLTQPREIVQQIVRELVKNALRVSDSVEVTATRNGEEWLLRVKDDGRGLTKEQMERAFQPFVSFSGGRGLGLFLARTHARQLGGDLLLSSEEGRGTEALLRLSPLVSLARRGET